jgi:hypothetical protein
MCSRSQYSGVLTWPMAVFGVSGPGPNTTIRPLVVKPAVSSRSMLSDDQPPPSQYSYPTIAGGGSVAAPACATGREMLPTTYAISVIGAAVQGARPPKPSSSAEPEWGCAPNGAIVWCAAPLAVVTS